MDSKEMYERYEQLLAKHGLNTSKVAKATGIDKSTFSKWKKLGSMPSTKTITTLANFFGVSVDYITYGDDVAKAIIEHENSVTYLDEEEKNALVKAVMKFSDVDFTPKQIDRIKRYIELEVERDGED